MSLAESIRDIFPTAEQIPPALDACLPVILDRHLVDGELRRWDGPMQKIHSPVAVRGPEDRARLRALGYLEPDAGATPAEASP